MLSCLTLQLRRRPVMDALPHVGKFDLVWPTSRELHKDHQGPYMMETLPGKASAGVAVGRSCAKKRLQSLWEQNGIRLVTPFFFGSKKARPARPVHRKRKTVGWPIPKAKKPARSLTSPFQPRPGLGKPPVSNVQ